MRTEHNSQLMPPNPAVRFDESDEGGLELGQVIGAIRRRVLLIAGITIGISAVAGFTALTARPLYQSQFELLTEPLTIETKIISSTNPQTLSNREEIVAVKADEVKLKILKSPEVLDSVIEKLQVSYPSISYSAITDKLKIVTIGENAEILTVSYQDYDSKLVESVLNLVSKTYLDYSLNTRQTGIGRGIQFVEEQLPKLRSRVAFQQERLQKIRQQHNLVEPEIKGQQLSALIGTFGQQKLETQIQLNEAKSLYASLQKELARQGAESATASALVVNPRYQSLINQLLQIDSQAAMDSALLLEGSPELKILRQQRQNLIPLIRQEGQRVSRETASRIQELETRDRVLTQAIESLNQEIKNLSATLREYQDIQRESEIATNNLNQFLSKREALRIDAAQKESPWRLLTPPGQPQPTAASFKRNLILGAMLGLLLGLGTALALDKLSNVLYTSREVKDATKLPILGIIPYEQELAKFNRTVTASTLTQQAGLDVRLGSEYNLPQGYFLSTFFEAFRSLYTNIYLFSADSPIHSVVVSSSASAEGRSTIAIYLAQAAATIGQRVLLVDTDLRRPTLHERLKLTNEQGLTNLLVEETLDVNRVIQRSPLEDNLFVLTAGSLPLDPTRLLASKKMCYLMERLHAAFDLVIYKAPPLLGVADTHLLANHTDGVLLVTALGKLKRSSLEQTLDELRISGTPILGVVANSIQEPLSSRFIKSSQTLERV
jgi:capsular exopolysaccharide synthesis family protein